MNTSDSSTIHAGATGQFTAGGITALVRPSRARAAREAAAAHTRARAKAVFGPPHPPDRQAWLRAPADPVAVSDRSTSGRAAGAAARTAVPTRPYETTPGSRDDRPRSSEPTVRTVVPAGRAAVRLGGIASRTMTTDPPQAPHTPGRPGQDIAPQPSPGVEPPSVGTRLGRARAWLYVRCGLELKTVLALVVVLAVATGLAVHHYWSGRPRTVRVPPPQPVAARLHAEPPPPPARLTVDVAGKVARPGLRHLPKGSRVADALAAAGGPLPGANVTTLNLARPLADGEQILVGLAQPALAQPPNPDDPAAASLPAGAAPATPVDLNSATAAQLDALPGVGPVLAQHIIDFRAQHGSFTSLQQLRQVPGIGDRKFSMLKSLVHP